MAQLGYTFYAKDWFTSNTRKRLKRFPLVRYVIRELIDLMNIESGPIEMNREYLIDDLDIELNDREFEKLMEFVEIQEDGRWWLHSIKKRMTKAETSRENGKKGGRPPGSKKTQKPRQKTQTKNLKNPPLEIERESKREIEIKEKGNNARAIDVLKTNKQSELDVLWMQNKNQIDDKNRLVDSFNDKMDIEVEQNKIEFTPEQLMPRFRTYVRQWVSNQTKKTNNQQEVSTRPNYF